MFDIIIKNGWIIDGSGGAKYKGDIGVAGDKIKDIGDLKDVETKQTIDATGKFVTPGFIDVHSHSDHPVIINPMAESKIRQGVTTEIIGQCGESPFPYRGAFYEREREVYKKYKLDIDWNDIEGYIKRYNEAKPTVNLVMFAGQGSIRGSVLGYTGKVPDSSEIAMMQKEVAKAMEAGAFGVSSGLIYPPGYWAKTDELAEVAKAAAPYGGIYTSHIRGEGDTLLTAIEEAIEIGKRAGLSVQISHLKACAKRNWGRVKDAIALIIKKRAEGIDVWWDKYPYIASATSLSSLLPDWAVEGGAAETVKRLKSKETKIKILEDVKHGSEKEEGYGYILITHAGCAKYKKFEGKRLTAIAEEIKMSEEETFVDMLIESNLTTNIAGFTMSQEDTDLAICHDLGMVCSDSGAYAPYGVLSESKPHPRTYGTFPRFFKYYVKDKKFLSVEKGVQKVSATPAKRFNIPKRGLLQKGFFADVVIIDWEKFEDKATFENPHQYAAGIDAVIVNGSLTIKDGEALNQNAGRIIKRNE